MGEADACVVALDPAGSLRWARSFGSTGYDRSGGVAIGDDGLVYVSGTTSAPIDFGGGTRTPDGDGDVFLAAFDATDGTHRWSVLVGGPGADFHGDVHRYPGDGVVLVGTFEGTMRLGGSVDLTSLGVEDAFVARYTSTGNLRWATRIGGASSDAAVGVGVSGGTVFAGGWFNGTLRAGALELASAGARDSWIVALDAFGRVRGAERLGGPGDDHLFGLAADPDGRLYVAGIVGDSDLGFDALTF